ncbi:MAG: MauE/DoxX family redox-associated membrane protein [Bacteroidota bacterium]
MRLLYLTIYILVATLFVVAGALKAYNPKEFIELFMGISFLSDRIDAFLALVFPYFEMVIGLLLFVRWRVGAILNLSLFISIVFVIISIYGYIYGYDSNCGCFGSLVEIKFGLVALFKSSIFFLAICYLKKENWQRPIIEE